jgi:hypothetical protein
VKEVMPTANARRFADLQPEKLAGTVVAARTCAKEEEIQMAKFLVVHPVGKQDVAKFTEMATPFAKAVKANATLDAYWIKSWYVPDEGKLYCEFDGKDAGSIRKVLDAAVKASFEVPTEGIYPIAMTVNSEDFR